MTTTAKKTACVVLKNFYGRGTGLNLVKGKSCVEKERRSKCCVFDCLSREIVLECLIMALPAPIFEALRMVNDGFKILLLRPCVNQREESG